MSVANTNTSKECFLEESLHSAHHHHHKIVILKTFIASIVAKISFGNICVQYCKMSDCSHNSPLRSFAQVYDGVRQWQYWQAQPAHSAAAVMVILAD